MEAKSITTVLLPEDIRRVVLALGADLESALGETNAFIAGGFIRAVVAGEEPSDVDVACEDEAHETQIIARVLDCGYDLKLATRNARTLTKPDSVPVQIIRRWRFTSIVSCVEANDYTIARAGIRRSTLGLWESAADVRFYPDLASRRLFYRAPVRVEDAGGSLMRVQKFVARGYFIDAEQLSKVTARAVCRLRLEDRPEDVQARLIQSVLVEVDPLRLVQGVPVDERVHLQTIKLG